MATASSGTHQSQQSVSSIPWLSAPNSFTSLTSSCHQDKHQKLNNNLKDSTFLPPHPTSSSPDRQVSHCHSGNLEKPKGKRPFKTKHTQGDAVEGEETDEKGSDNEEVSGKFGFVLFCLFLRRASF